MNRISGQTSFYKVIFPTLWFGGLALWVLVSAWRGHSELIYYGVPLALAVIAFVVWRKFAWQLVDAVYDAGDHLEFRNGDQRQRVPFADIERVERAWVMSPERIIVHARTPGPLGRMLVFTPPFRLRRYAESALADELVERVEAARRG